MRIYKTKNYDEMSRKAANIISAQIILKPESVLGLATGSSPIGTYKQLIEWYNKGDLDSTLTNTKAFLPTTIRVTLTLCATTCLTT